MALLSDIIDFCEGRIHTSTIPDFPGAQNGLQLSNDGSVSKVGAAVDAGLIPFEKAVAAGIDFLLVHHGMFWDPAYPITGTRYEKYKLCMDNNLAVYGAHLPLDCHREIGNNAILAAKLELEPLEWFHEYEGTAIGLITKGVTREDLHRRLGALFPNGFTAIEKGSKEPEKIAILSGSGGTVVSELKSLEVNTLITGELKQNHFNLAEEDGLNLYLCGHYATETFGVCALASEIAEQFGLEWEFIETDCPI